MRIHELNQEKFQLAAEKFKAINKQFEMRIPDSNFRVKLRTRQDTYRVHYCILKEFFRGEL